jgi:hypothetical protein
VIDDSRKNDMTMTSYRRIISPPEAAIIYGGHIVPTNFTECHPYPRQSVIFLFTASVLATPWMLKSIVEANRVQYAKALMLSFDATIPTSADLSGWGPIGAVVFEGPLTLEPDKYTIADVPPTWPPVAP